MMADMNSFDNRHSGFTEIYDLALTQHHTRYDSCLVDVH